MDVSYWESDALLSADFIVIGAGLMGLQTALELRALRPADRIVVLERGLTPAGASSRNAGFACFGSLTELLSDIDLIGTRRAVALVERRWRGLQRLRARIPDAHIGYEPLGSHELLDAQHLVALDRLDHVNALLRPLFGEDVFRPDETQLRDGGFGATRALVANRHEGQLHSGLLMRTLMRQARAADIDIRCGARVQALDDSGHAVRVEVSDGFGKTVTMRASRVVACANGLSADLLPSTGIVPGRGQVLVTAPVPGLPWRGAFHRESGYFYFRNIGERILIGGGRHLDFSGETTTAMALSPIVQSALERLLSEVVLPGRQVTIDYRWAGIMGFSADRMPQARWLSPRVALGFACNGMGVALATDVAAETAALVAAG